MRQYVLPFSGLKLGQHTYDFTMTKVYFDALAKLEETSEIYGLIDANIELKLTLEKQQNMLQFDFNFTGSIEVACDRCNDPLSVDASSSRKLIVKFGENDMEETDEIIVLQESEHKIDITHYIYEFITLALPAKRAHSIEDCNQEVIDQINHISEQNDSAPTDPRWDALKQID